MINSILGYILKRESYRKFRDLQNLNTQDKTNLFNNLGKLAWLVIWGIICISTIININFIVGVSLFFVPISLTTFISSFFSSRKKTRPIYENVPVKKSDRRYKGGYRIDSYKQVVTGRVELTQDEITIRKTHFKGRMYFWAFISVISVTTFIYSFNKAPMTSSKTAVTLEPWDVVKTGDKIYVTKDAVIETISGIKIYQLARPINKSDINSMKIEDWKKRQMTDKIDSNLSNELIPAFEYESDFFYKNKSSYIGSYLSKDSTFYVSGDDGKRWIEIIPKSKNANFKSIFYEKKDGYVFTNKFYINANQISLTDYLKQK
ncbi:MAG TPA: hypothetical protein DIT07_14695 [Sphingobacteriaceae bacterium]|nr:hypothetical protein [Sphingobacteriaceae bacterium]